MKLVTAKRKFKGEWIAFRFSDEAKEEGEVIARAKNRPKLNQKLQSLHISGVYVTFAGPLLPKGYGIAISPFFKSKSAIE